MSQGIVAVAYIGAAIMFILALGGLSKPETSRRGNLYGVLGMLMDGGGEEVVVRRLLVKRE